MEFEPNIINNLIEQRRSVFQRQYSGERVDDAVVKQMLENANWAPTHKLTEPWRFIVFTKDGLQKLADFQSALYKEVSTSRGTFKEVTFQNLLTKPSLSSHIIAIAMKREPKKSLPELEELGAVYCAIENMYLTATAYGIGCYLSTGGVTYYEEAKSFFGLEADDKLLGFFHVGIPKGDLPAGKRTPVSEKTKWIS
ncbi:MAG: nitroreductase [Chryseolinea sp.]